MTDGCPMISDGEIDIQPLITKLGHSVEEIRVRALQNIVFKLNHELLSVSDVVHKKELFVKLLEWFNIEPCSQQKDVLQLLEKLSKHSSGLDTLVSIGAVDFLSYLRQDVDPSLYQYIDSVLTNLLSLPEVLDIDDEQLYYDRGKQASASDENAKFSGEVLKEHEERGSHVKVSIAETQHTREGCTAVTTQKPLDEIKLNTTQHEWHAAAGDRIQDESIWRFPWISLADSDRHVLATTNTRLQSKNTSLAKKSCEFLSDVLFKDFPAEIFLQRPSIVMTLLTLLEMQSLETQNLSLLAVSCLSTLCVHLKHRYQLMTDPQWYSLYPDCWKHWFGSSLSSSANVSPTSEMSDLRTTGDGGERSGESSKIDSGGFVFDSESDGLVREALELNQMSIDEFCLQVLRGCCSLLNNVVDPLLVLGALQEGLSLLEVSCLRQHWWNQRKMKPLRDDICRFACKTINHHMLKCGLKPSDGHDIVEHNITRHALTVVNIALWLMEFCGPLVTSDMNETDEDLSDAFQALLTNEILFTTLPGMRACLERCPVLTNDVEFMEIYTRALAVKHSLIASVNFLKEVRLKRETQRDALILKLDSCLLGLPYHRHQELITHAIYLISSAYQRPTAHAPRLSTYEETKSKSKNILLTLLSCADVAVRRETYKCCFEVLKKAFKHSHVTNPMSSHCTKALFMIDRDVIYIVCAFGMADPDEEIAQTARSIIETLLNSRLNMESQIWRRLLDDLVTSLPFLQMYLDKRTKLGSCLLGLLAPPGESPCSLTADGEIVPFSQFERLRGWLRCMFLKDKTLRAKGYGYLIHYLVQQDVKSKFEMVYPSGGLEKSCDLFIIETFAASVRLHRSSKHANFDEERIRKLFDIAAMETNEVSLRKSSAEQLAVLIQDPTWHSALLEEKHEDSLVKILHECLLKDGKASISPVVNPKLDLVSPCLKTLRLLVEYNVRCRHKLAQDSSVYIILSRHALLAPVGGSVRYEASCLMTLLLFDEVARCPLPNERQENGGDIMFALPALVLKRYSLPFNPPIYEMYNPYQREKLTEPNPLRTEPMLSMLRVAWNLAWCENSDDVPQETTENEDGVNKELSWTSLDSKLLKYCSVKVAVNEAIKSVVKATSHYAVRLSVHKLSMHFLAENCVKSEQQFEGESSRNLSRQVFYSCDWRTAFERYFIVYPKSSDDDRLLGDVLKMFRDLITDPYPVPPENFLGWLAHVIMTPDSAISSLLHVREEPGDSPQSESKRLLRKDLLEFLAIFIRRLRRISKPWLWSGEMIYAGDFTLSLTLNLNLTESPQYYDLPVLESTLQCLVEITSIPGFSTASKLVDPKELCVDILTSLLQVLTAFNAGRLGAVTSFMGRGVTLTVSQCMTHLVHEISTMLKMEDWPSLFPTIADSDNQDDFPWLSAMWTDHLAEVRWCGLAIATHILQHTGSPLSIKQNFAGGLWNLSVIIFMDSKECCLVRDQAAALFCTLLACLNENKDNQKFETGLMVQTENEIISGIPALHLLLAYHKFYPSFHQMLRNLVIQNTPRLPGTATFTESLGTSSTRTKYGIPYQSLDTDSQRSSSRSSTETTSLTSSSSSAHTGDSGKRLLRESPATLSLTGSTGVSTRPSSTIPLITGSRVASETTGNENRSSTSPVSVEPLEILAWVTPRFVVSLSGLLTNLVQVSPEIVLDKIKDEDVLGIFVSHLDSKHATSLISHLRTCSTLTSQQRHIELYLIDTLEMYRQVCVLLVTCAARDPLICHALQQNAVVLERILQLFDVDCSGFASSVLTSCRRMWGSVVVLIMSLVKTVKENQLLETPLEEMLLKHWNIFTVALKEVMLMDDVKIRAKFLHLLSYLLLREGKRAISGKGADQKLTHLLDTDNTWGKNEEKVNDTTKSTSEDRDGIQFTGNGAGLCRILLCVYDDDKQTKDANCIEERKFLVLALRNLLCISHKAKEAVIEAAFLAKSLDKIKQLHYQLNMESLDVGKASGTRKKEMDLFKEIVCVLELVKNLVFRSNKAKLKAIDAGVVSVLQQLWPWCTAEKTICLAVLEVLCTLTARCPQASITMSNTSSGVGSTVRLGPSNNTFVHCVIKMASKFGGKLLNNTTGHGNLASGQILFSLLKNLAMTSECRGIMWKSNFIVEFSRLKSLSHQKWKGGQKTIISLWLELLANIAFHRDGQQMIVKIESIIPLLVEFSASNSKKINEAAMLVLRNLCFHVPSKTLLLSNSEVVELILKNVDKPSVYLRALSASALWALLTNNQKAKSFLPKPALVVKRLSDSKLSLKPRTQECGVDARDENHKEQYEEAVENVLKILGC